MPNVLDPEVTDTESTALMLTSALLEMSIPFDVESMSTDEAETSKFSFTVMMRSSPTSTA
eukprot:COSAG06_NODE_6439_length_2933_cov_1.442484_1_plen_59_part_10